MDERRSEFPFHHGRVSLSFAGTLADRGSAPFERIPTPARLADWLVAADLMPEPLPVTARAHREALRLREAIARAVAAVVARTGPAAGDVALLNAMAKRGVNRRVLDAATLTFVDDARDPIAAALGALARDVIALLADPGERERLRACGLDACGSIFLTPAGRRERRWCSMARCGNRAKVHAFRQRELAGARAAGRE